MKKKKKTFVWNSFIKNFFLGGGVRLRDIAIGTVIKKMLAQAQVNKIEFRHVYKPFLQSIPLLLEHGKRSGGVTIGSISESYGANFFYRLACRLQ